MPTISIFFGIYITMYNTNEHNPPHFHADYQGYSAMFDFNGQILEGKLPKKQQRLIATWAKLHHDELLFNWNLVMSKGTLLKIQPLR